MIDTEPACDMYWSSHNCDLPEGHDDGDPHAWHYCGEPDDPCSRFSRAAGPPRLSQGVMVYPGVVQYADPAAADDDRAWNWTAPTPQHCMMLADPDLRWDAFMPPLPPDTRTPLERYIGDALMEALDLDEAVLYGNGSPL